MNKVVLYYVLILNNLYLIIIYFVLTIINTEKNSFKNLQQTVMVETTILENFDLAFRELGVKIRDVWIESNKA